MQWRCRSRRAIDARAAAPAGCPSAQGLPRKQDSRPSWRRQLHPTMASVDRGVCVDRGGAKSQKSGKGARKTSGRGKEHSGKLKVETLKAQNAGNTSRCCGSFICMIGCMCLSRETTKYLAYLALVRLCLTTCLITVSLLIRANTSTASIQTCADGYVIGFSRCCLTKRPES